MKLFLKNELNKGDVFLYSWKNVVNGCGIVLDIVLISRNLQYLLIALSEENKELKSVEDVLECKLKSVSWFPNDELISLNRIKVIGKVMCPDQYNNRAGLRKSEDIFYCYNKGRKSLFLLKNRLLYIPDTQLCELLDSKRLPKTR